MDTKISDKIRMFRGLLNLTPEEFWKKCGIQDLFEDYDKGEIHPPYEALEAMESMGLNLNFLFNDKEPMMKKDLENLINVVSEGISADDSGRVDRMIEILETQIEQNINALKMIKELANRQLYQHLIWYNFFSFVEFNVKFFEFA